MRPLPIQFRVYPDKIRTRNTKGKSRVPINWTLTFDTETTTDETQRLLFGWAQLRTVRQDDNGIPDKTVCVREICFYADDLPEFRPATFQALQRYVKDVFQDDGRREANTRLTYPWRYDHDHGQLGVEPRLNIIFIPASKFVEDYLLNCGYADVRTKDQWYQPATITGFNLSFDVWRLVTRVKTEQHGWHYGGLGGEFLIGKPWASSYGEYPMGIGMNRWMTYTNVRKQSERDGKPPAYFVDLAQLGMALTARKSNLLSAGKTFGAQTLKYEGKEIHDPEKNYHGPDGWERLYRYISYARNDVNATAELWEKESIRFYSHPIDLLPSDTYSPASISKGYFRAMGIHPPLCGCRVCRRKKRGAHKKVLKQVLGLAMGGFFGGRSEVKIRMLTLSAVLLDFVSMYPLIMILAGIWELLIADSIECREETEQVQALLDNLTMDDLRDPETWRQLCGIVEFKPDEDIVPVRTPYVDTSKITNKKVTASAANIGINYLTANRNLPYALYDVADGIVLSDFKRRPRINRAWRFYPVGKQSTLKPVKFMGNDDLTFDPNEDNLFKWVITQRKIIAGHHADYKDVNANQSYTLNDVFSKDLPPSIQKRLREHVLCRGEQLCGHCQNVIDDLRQFVNASKPNQEYLLDDLLTDSFQENMKVNDFQMREAHQSDNDNSGTWNEDTDKCLCDACIQKQFIKIFANAIYGIFAEMNTNTRAQQTRSDVYGLEDESFKPVNPEEPGEFCFPPFSTIVTAGARLMLGLVEKMVTDLGSQIVFCDTDSACIPATKDGVVTDEVKLLTYEQVDQIRAWFRSLNPYDERIVPDLLDWQYPKRYGDAYPDQPVYVTAISAKRYAIYRIVNGEPVLIRVVDDNETDTESDLEMVSMDDVEVIKRSEHGLGLYVNPLAQQQRTVADKDDDARPDWISEAWIYMIKRDVFGQDIPEPSWFDLPAVSRFPIKTKMVYETFKDYNSGKSIDWQVRPYNFYLAFHLNRWGQTQRPSMRLIAPFNDDPASWTELEVIDIHTRKKYRVTTDSECADPSRLYVKTYRDVINEYVTHPEYKFDDSDGNICGMHTKGMLQRTHVLMTSTQYITKDATSLTTDAESFTNTGPRVYKDDSAIGAFHIAIEMLKEQGVTGTKLGEIARVDRRNGARYLKGTQTPSPIVMDRIIHHAANLVRDEIGDPSLSDRQVLGMWKHRKDKANKDKPAPKPDGKTSPNRKSPAKPVEVPLSNEVVTDPKPILNITFRKGWLTGTERPTNEK